MNIAVFCSSSHRISDDYKLEAFQFGKWIAESGNTLVYGGATGGLMDAVSKGTHSKNGNIIGIIPHAVIKMNRQSALPTQLIKVETMSDRKAKMKEVSDVFVALPGSYGTLDEMLDIIASGIVGEHHKPLIIVNHKGFYNLFLQQIEFIREEQFMPIIETYKPLIATDFKHCIKLLEF